MRNEKESFFIGGLPGFALRRFNAFRCIFIKMDIKYYGNDDNYAVQSEKLKA